MTENNNRTRLTRLRISPYLMDRIKRKDDTNVPVPEIPGDRKKNSSATEGPPRECLEETDTKGREKKPASDRTPRLKTLDQFEQKEADWLFQGYIPKGQITTLASDGGIGKTSLWISLAAAVSSGKPCFLDGAAREPGKVLFMSTEDSVRVVLKKRLLAAGAMESNVISPDFSSDEGGLFRRIRFGSRDLEQVIAGVKPDLCIFDPLQGFLPQGTQMGDRAAMRNCLAPLISLGEKYGTAFLIVCHTNKRQNASGRNRIADSADLWDISRSVLMMGWTDEEGVRYLSQEKCNYGPLQESILFTMDEDGVIHPVGTTWKRDREFHSEGKSPRCRQEDAGKWLIDYLEEHGGRESTKTLADEAEKEGISEKTLERARKALQLEGKIRSGCTGYKSEKRYYWELTYLPLLCQNENLRE